MANSKPGDEFIVAELTFIKDGEKFPSRSLVVGNPGKIIPDESEEMIQGKTKRTQLYQQLPSNMLQSSMPCEPLWDETGDRPAGDKTYKHWKNQ